VHIKVQLLALVVLLCCVSCAAGAEYTVVTCSGQAAGSGGWAGFTGGAHPASIAENCLTGGGAMTAILRGTASPPAGNAGWQVFAPANTTVAGATLYRRVGVAGTGYGFVARGVTPGAAGTYPVIESCSGPNGCAAVMDRTSIAWRSPRTDVNRLQAYVRCQAPCQALGTPEAAAVRISRADIALSDVSAPTLASGPSSAMFDAATPVSGVQSIVATFNDTGGGIASTGVQVDGRTVGEVPVSTASCRTPYRRLVPCPLTLSTTLQFNPASVPDGAHQLRVFARDATGVNVGYSASFAITTSARGAINGTNGSDQVRLSLGVRRAVHAGRRAPRSQATLDVPFDAKTVADGRLLNRAGQPVVGARLLVATAVDRGAPVYSVLPSNVVTDASGRFKVTLPRGPSVRVRALYFARALDIAPAARDDARVKVATHATFSARDRRLRPGARAVFRGRVVGRFRPAGIRVELQGRRGRGYVTLGSAATKPDGTYRVGYRFTRGARGRYVFRLRVRHFPRFPYFLGYSRPTSLVVR
jgi:hypothetical protein